MSEPFDPLIRRVLPEVIAFRHEMHAHPELSFQEHETAARIRAKLATLPGIEVRPPLLETDVVALLNGDKPGPCFALRADIDALPIEEQGDVAYKSTVPGRMHACGHDGHTSVLLGAAMVLSQMADALPGKVKFIFQPAEEEGGGGGKLCERGVLDDPKVDAAAALHAWPMQPVGTMSVRPGPVAAACNDFKITIRGRAGHGAYPHRCVDPIVIAAEVIGALQTIVSREVPPTDAGVVTVGAIQGGSTTNVIPPEVVMQGTIRYYRDETGEQMRRRVEAIVEHIPRAHGGEGVIELRNGYPSLLNDPNMTELAISVGREVLGESNVSTNEDPSMGAEDFAYYSRRIPVSMFRLGIRPAGVDAYPGLHHPKFDFTDDALPVGIRLFCEIASRYLHAHAGS